MASTIDADLSKLEVIFKLAGNCNINCTYCYVYNGQDTSYKGQPSIASFEVVNQAALFLRAGCLQLGLRALQIDFHGGEPLLVGKHRFREICRSFRNSLDPIVDLRLAIQTNATLVDEDWVNLFEEFRVSPGVSLDGPQPYNDKYRVDFQGRGTYQRVVRGLSLLQTAIVEGRLDSLGVLAVVNPSHSGAHTYKHLVHELNIRTLDFLLPDSTHDAFTENATHYGKYLCEIFDSWAEDDDPEIRVRILNSVMSLLLGGRSKVVGFGQEMPLAITIAADGTLGVDDTLRSCGTDYYSTGLNITTCDLHEFLNHRHMREIAESNKVLPEVCSKCCWKRVCGGGHLVHRYSRRDGFNNKSILCEGLKLFYSHVAAYLLEKGLSVDFLIEKLIISNADTHHDSHHRLTYTNIGKANS